VRTLVIFGSSIAVDSEAIVDAASWIIGARETVRLITQAKHKIKYNDIKKM